MGVAKDFKELRVYMTAKALAKKVFVLTLGFPPEEKYGLTSQIRRSSRSLCGNIAEAWRKRRYRAAFIAKLNDVEAEGAETQAWLEIGLDCEYLTAATQQELDAAYAQLISQISKMIEEPDTWLLSPPPLHLSTPPRP